MTEKTSEKQIPLYKQVCEQILDTIMNMEPDNNRLQPEEVLAKQLGTSRATIREAMASLIREGYITRWQGKGNFGHPSVAKLGMRIDVNSDFRRLITDSGGTVSVTQDHIRIATPSKRMTHRMPESTQDQVLAMDWIYHKDGNPVIICRIEILRHLVRKLPKQGFPQEKLSEFLKYHCDVDIVYTTTWLRSEIEPHMARLLRIEESRSMLVWEEVFYDLHENKICFNTIYFHPDQIDLSMLLTM